MSGRIAQLSLSALRMAAAHRQAEPGELARFLYRFGTVPRSPAVERDFGPDDDPMAVLSLTSGGQARRILDTVFNATSFDGWYSFSRVPTDARLQSVCKLYVSPRPEALADAFPRSAAVFAESGVRSFKVGRGIEGLLRPDKIVAYFEDKTHQADVAAAIVHTLAGCPAQSVPFTNEVGGDGIVSAGVDPPAGDTPTSWRAWVTERLASAVSASLAMDVEGRVRAALEGIQAAGVDPFSWTLIDGAFAPSGMS